MHERAFHGVAGGEAWKRVIALVVQPGVEFGHEEVAVYRPDEARGLSDSLRALPGLVFEAHSTDYQPEASLRQLVSDGFPILKVGPGLTFALREALYGLDAIAAALRPGALVPLPSVLEELMLAKPEHWERHYPGTSDERRVLRHFSYSDRIRYYWPAPQAEAAVEGLLRALKGSVIPQTLVSQYLPRLYDRVASGEVPADPRRLAREAVRDVLRSYGRACAPAGR